MSETVKNALNKVEIVYDIYGGLDSGDEITDAVDCATCSYAGKCGLKGANTKCFFVSGCREAMRIKSICIDDYLLDGAYPDPKITDDGSGTITVQMRANYRQGY